MYLIGDNVIRLQWRPGQNNQPRPGVILAPSTNSRQKYFSFHYLSIFASAAG